MFCARACRETVYPAATAQTGAFYPPELTKSAVLMNRTLRSSLTALSPSLHACQTGHRSGTYITLEKLPGENVTYTVCLAHSKRCELYLINAPMLLENYPLPRTSGCISSALPHHVSRIHPASRLRAACMFSSVSGQSAPSTMDRCLSPLGQRYSVSSARPRASPAHSPPDPRTCDRR